MYRFLFVLFLIISVNLKCFSQQIHYFSDNFYGGVTGGGYNHGFFAYSDTIILNIPIGCTIRKAILFYSVSSWSNENTLSFKRPIVLNGDTIYLSTTNSVQNTFKLNSDSPSYQIDISTLVNDVTHQISLNPQPTIHIQPPEQPNFPIFWEYYILVLYEDYSLQKTAVDVYLNKQNCSPIMNYELVSSSQMDLNEDVALSLNTGSICDTIDDGSLVSVNSNLLGLIGGNEYNSAPTYCMSPSGNYYYENNTLYGLTDDTADSMMISTDVLANILPYSTSSPINVRFEYQSTQNQGSYSNAINQLFLTYTTPCDTFSVTTTADTTVCYGEELQLSSSGGNAYEWRAMKGGNVNGNVPGLSCSDCPNPVFTADSSMTYTVRIWNTDSCSVVRPIAIRVSGREKLGAYSLPTECGASTGSLVVNAVPQEAANWFAVTPNNDTLTAADAVGNTLSDLSSGVYRLFYSDNVGCISRDTLVEIGTNNSTVADFSVQPTTGAAPLEIDIENLSQNATASEWYLNENYVGTSPPALLDTAGGFEITLVAWQNDLTCADTVTKTVLVYDSLMVTIPNVFTPNNDGVNDFFTVGVNLPVKVDLTIVNRWGNTVFTNQEALSKGQHELWNGSLSSGEQVNDGVYFYTLRFTLEGQAQETVTKTGFLHVFGE